MAEYTGADGFTNPFAARQRETVEQAQRNQRAEALAGYREDLQEDALEREDLFGQTTRTGTRADNIFFGAAELRHQPPGQGPIRAPRQDGEEADFYQRSQVREQIAQREARTAAGSRSHFGSSRSPPGGLAAGHAAVANVGETHLGPVGTFPRPGADATQYTIFTPAGGPSAAAPVVFGPGHTTYGKDGAVEGGMPPAPEQQPRLVTPRPRPPAQPIGGRASPSASLLEPSSDGVARAALERQMAVQRRMELLRDEAQWALGAQNQALAEQQAALAEQQAQMQASQLRVDTLNQELGVAGFAVQQQAQQHAEVQGRQHLDAGAAVRMSAEQATQIERQRQEAARQEREQLLNAEIETARVEGERIRREAADALQRERAAMREEVERERAAMERERVDYREQLATAQLRSSCAEGLAKMPAVVHKGVSPATQVPQTPVAPMAAGGVWGHATPEGERMARQRDFLARIGRAARGEADVPMDDVSGTVHPPGCARPSQADTFFPPAKSPFATYAPTPPLPTEPPGLGGGAGGGPAPQPGGPTTGHVSPAPADSVPLSELAAALQSVAKAVAGQRPEGTGMKVEKKAICIKAEERDKLVDELVDLDVRWGELQLKTWRGKWGVFRAACEGRAKLLIDSDMLTQGITDDVLATMDDNAFKVLTQYFIDYIKSKAGLTKQVEIELAVKAVNAVRMKSSTREAAQAFIDAYRRAYLKEQRADLVDLGVKGVTRRFVEFQDKLHPDLKVWIAKLPVSLRPTSHETGIEAVEAWIEAERNRGNSGDAAKFANLEKQVKALQISGASTPSTASSSAASQFPARLKPIIAAMGKDDARGLQQALARRNAGGWKSSPKGGKPAGKKGSGGGKGTPAEAGFQTCVRCNGIHEPKLPRANCPNQIATDNQKYQAYITEGHKCDYFVGTKDNGEKWQCRGKGHGRAEHMEAVKRLHAGGKGKGGKDGGKPKGKGGKKGKKGKGGRVGALGDADGADGDGAADGAAADDESYWDEGDTWTHYDNMLESIWELSGDVVTGLAQPKEGLGALDDCARSEVPVSDRVIMEPVCSRCGPPVAKDPVGVSAGLHWVDCDAFPADALHAGVERSASSTDEVVEEPPPMVDSDTESDTNSSCDGSSDEDTSVDVGQSCGQVLAIRDWIVNQSQGPLRRLFAAQALQPQHGGPAECDGSSPAAHTSEATASCSPPAAANQSSSPLSAEHLRTGSVEDQEHLRPGSVEDPLSPGEGVVPNGAPVGFETRNTGGVTYQRHHNVMKDPGLIEKCKGAIFNLGVWWHTHRPGSTIPGVDSCCPAKAQATSGSAESGPINREDAQQSAAAVGPPEECPFKHIPKDGVAGAGPQYKSFRRTWQCRAVLLEGVAPSVEIIYENVCVREVSEPRVVITLTYPGTLFRAEGQVPPPVQAQRSTEGEQLLSVCVQWELRKAPHHVHGGMDGFPTGIPHNLLAIWWRGRMVLRRLVGTVVVAN